jgi:hypothetical protein
MKKLRRVCFPIGKPWEKEDRKLYSQMKETLREVMDEPDLKGDWKRQRATMKGEFNLGVREVRAVIYCDFQCLVSIAIHPPFTLHNPMPLGTVESQGRSLPDAFNPWSARCLLNFVVIGSPGYFGWYAVGTGR